MKIISFTVADTNNLKYYETLKKSWNKFHPDIELKLYTQEDITKYNDNALYYRATPVFGQKLLEKYDIVIKIDADSLILGDLSHIWKDTQFDIAVVQNGNPRETKKYPVSVWDIPPPAYVNCGLVVIRSRPFVDHWKWLCYSPHFQSYQFREQDLLNIMLYYNIPTYRTRFLDVSSKWHGLIARGYEPQMIMRDGKIILPKSSEWPLDEDKEIVVWHAAGGNIQDKMNYRTKFTDEVVDYIDSILK